MRKSLPGLCAQVGMGRTTHRKVRFGEFSPFAFSGACWTVCTAGSDQGQVGAGRADGAIDGHSCHVQKGTVMILDSQYSGWESGRASRQTDPRPRDSRRQVWTCCVLLAALGPLVGQLPTLTVCAMGAGLRGALSGRDRDGSILRPRLRGSSRRPRMPRRLTPDGVAEGEQTPQPNLADVPTRRWSLSAEGPRRYSRTRIRIARRLALLSTRPVDGEFLETHAADRSGNSPRELSGHGSESGRPRANRSRADQGSRHPTSGRPGPVSVGHRPAILVDRPVAPSGATCKRSPASTRATARPPGSRSGSARLTSCTGASAPPWIHGIRRAA